MDLNAHSAVVDDDNVAHAWKSFRFDISNAGVGVAIDVDRQMRLLTRASTPAERDAFAAL